MDVYLPPSSGGAQVHDLNPTAFPPVGLFWTLEIPITGIDVQPGKGSAVYEASDVPILDYGDVGNAIFGGGQAPIPGTVSFKVTWSGVDQRVNIRNTDPVFGGFAGEFVRNTAQMEWTAEVGDFSFASDPISTSSSSFAEIGQERNGIFFPG